MAYRSGYEVLSGFWEWADTDPEGIRIAEDIMSYGGSDDDKDDYDVSDVDRVSTVLSWSPRSEMASEYLRRCVDGGEKRSLVLGPGLAEAIEDSYDVSIRSGSIECLLRYIATTGKSYNDD